LQLGTTGIVFKHAVTVEVRQPGASLATLPKIPEGIMTISSGQCVFVILLLAAFIGLWRGWMREIITMGILLAAILFLSTVGNALLYRFFFVNLAASFHALLSGSSVNVGSDASSAQNADGDTAFTLVTFSSLTLMGYFIGHKAGKPPTVATHRLVGIIPGAINGIAITFYTVSRIIPQLQVNAQGPNQGSVISDFPLVFGIGLLFLVVVLFVFLRKK
jgi:hypothetical protein